MKIKVSEATNFQLDWMVAKCRGYTDIKIFKPWRQTDQGWIEVRFNPEPKANTARYSPTTDWAQGGLIIDLMINDGYIIQRGEFNTGIKVMRLKSGDIECQFGPTSLIAAMRCYVSSNMGDIVDIP